MKKIYSFAITTTIIGLMTIPAQSNAQSSAQTRAEARAEARLKLKKIRIANSNPRIRKAVDIKTKYIPSKSVQVRLNTISAASRRLRRIEQLQRRRNARIQQRTQLSNNRVRSRLISTSKSDNQKAVDLINTMRNTKKRSPLTLNTSLSRTALEVIDLYSNTTSLADRAKKAGYANLDPETCNCRAWKYYVKTLSLEGDQPLELLEDFLKQQGSQDLLHSRYQDIGIAIKGKVLQIVLGEISIEEIEPFTQNEQTSFAEEVFELTNKERINAGLQPLSKNTTLEKAAMNHAKDMWQRKFYAHVTPEGITLQDRLKSAGYFSTNLQNCNCRSYSYKSGENIAKGQRTPEEVVKGWMNSPPHRENILSANFDEIGIGAEGNLWVQNFGSLILNK